MSASPAERGRTLARPGPPEFKTDRPRKIDRYIDYFGDGTARGATAALHPEQMTAPRDTTPALDDDPTLQ